MATKSKLATFAPMSTTEIFVTESTLTSVLPTVANVTEFNSATETLAKDYAAKSGGAIGDRMNLLKLLASASANNVLRDNKSLKGKENPVAQWYGEHWAKFTGMNENTLKQDVSQLRHIVTLGNTYGPAITAKTFETYNDAMEKAVKAKKTVRNMFPALIAAVKSVNENKGKTAKIASAILVPDTDPRTAIQMIESVIKTLGQVEKGNDTRPAMTSEAITQAVALLRTLVPAKAE